MDDSLYTGLTTGVALLVYYFTLTKSALARGKHGVEAPSHDGPEEYMRYVRVHQNTLEHIVIFIPALWLFAYSVDFFWAAAIGLVWPVGRLFYAFGYYEAADKRMPGFILSMLPLYVLVLGGIIGCVWDLTMLEV
ncbi:MAG: MAPEG domain-containing protein [Gammaproteobacteria bacterium]|nr:MAPEG domain-containing protein [Gammaproteobacteria bacterium]|tara:strand:+ start:716 stop:1120 length:405 start_codon:yes stop_codon:yes gene_type:complete